MAALALLKSALAAPANDNTGTRYSGTGTEGDRWNWLIERFKAIHMPLAVMAAQHRLKGMTVEAFCHAFLAAMESAQREEAR